MSPKQPYKLYWVATDDHDEDWFVIAQDEFQAMDFFETFEGYDPGEAWAEEILQIPDHISCKSGWPDHDLLVSLGAKFLHDDDIRVVEINGKTYCEGMLESEIKEITDNVYEIWNGKRPNKTKKTNRNKQ